MVQSGVINENPAYTYTLYAPGKGRDAVYVTGRLPQEWLLSTGSTWDGNASGDTTKEITNSIGGVIGQAGSLATTLGGSNVGFTGLSNRQWSGGQPFTFNLLAEFNAYEDEIEDVMRPVVLLQSMTMPTILGNPSVSLPNGANISAGNVIGPPYWKDAKDSQQVGGRSTIMLRVGELFVFDDIIVESVNATQIMRMTERGAPIKIVTEIQAATRGPITFEQYVSYMTGKALSTLFKGNDRIQAARESGPGQRASYSGLKATPPKT